MKIIHVIPISRGVILDHLSYFTSADVSIGKTVLVPVRKKMVHAIIVDVEDVSRAKSDIKSAAFSLRKIEQVETNQFLTAEFMKSATETADYFATAVGSVLGSLVPKTVLSGLSDVSAIEPGAKQKNKTEKSPEQLVLQAEDEERFANYKSLIREEFARNFSVFFCLPTIEDIKKAQRGLEKGIEKYTYVFHSGLKKKELLSLWKKVLEETHPVLIIATGQYFCVPRVDIGTVVVEREGSRAYKMPIRPFLDIRVFAAYFAKNIKARLLFGDMLLRTETIWSLKNGDYIEFSPLKFRSTTTATELVVDTRIDPDNKEVAFSSISKELGELISWNKERNENLFIFAARKGLAPLTLCGDCGTIATCSACSSPVVLHGADGRDEDSGNFFECHTCGRRRGTKEKCRNCTSWKLITLGIGIELIEKEIKEKFPTIRVFRLDAASAPTHKKALDIVQKFYNTPGSILVGTEMALLYMDKQVENAAIASIDPLFALPDFRIGEKILSILLKIRSLAKENFVLQTRNPEEKIFDYAIKGSLADFYRDEIENRRTFGYPPFSTFIKITMQGEKSVVESEMKKLPSQFEPYEADVFPAFTAVARGKHVMHAVIKIPREKWVDKRILAILRSLPPQCMIKVDPESIL